LSNIASLPLTNRVLLDRAWYASDAHGRTWELSK